MVLNATRGPITRLIARTRDESSVSFSSKHRKNFGVFLNVFFSPTNILHEEQKMFSMQSIYYSKCFNIMYTNSVWLERYWRDIFKTKWKPRFIVSMAKRDSFFKDRLKSMRMSNFFSRYKKLFVHIVCRYSPKLFPLSWNNKIGDISSSFYHRKIGSMLQNLSPVVIDYRANWCMYSHNRSISANQYLGTSSFHSRNTSLFAEALALVK